jgi:type II secretory pathway pseudopilin PulG
MASLSDRPPKNNKTIYLGIIVLVAIVIIIIAGITGYFYLDNQDKQAKQHRDSLSQAFGDQLNATDDLYASITGYQAAPNKNYVDDFRTWIDGYRQRVDNYTLAAGQLVAAGADYKTALSSDDTDYANVTKACNQANNTIKSLNDTISRYESEYQERVWQKDNATRSYNEALARADSLYNAAWSLMQKDTTYDLLFGGYHAYLIACQSNNSFYNGSISLVRSAGDSYRGYLKGNSYYDIDTTISGMQDNVTKLEKRYAELLKNIPNVTVDLADTAPTVGTADGVRFTTVYSFQIHNRDWPKKVWDIVAHFQLIDRDTGAVRSTADFTVPPMSMYITTFHTVNLECDLNKQYYVNYTVSYEY